MSHKQRFSLINVLASSDLFEEMDDSTQATINTKIKKLKRFILRVAEQQNTVGDEVYTATIDLPEWVIDMDDIPDDEPSSPVNPNFNSVAKLETFCFVDLNATTQLSCLICMDNFTDKSIVRQLPCQHIFCDKCILQWFDHSDACPKCRGQISKN
jgi:hypothetical protein